MATWDDFRQVALARGKTPAEIDAYIASQQFGGAGAPVAEQVLRYPGIAVEQGLSGLESTIGLPERGINYLSGKVGQLMGRQLPQVPDIGAAAENLTNVMRLTNSPALTPGYGALPGLERIIGEGARGAGAALPFLATGMPPALLFPGAAASGAAAGATEQLTGPNSIAPALVGLGVGALTGGLANALKPREDFGETFNKIAGDMGASGATMMTAGQAIKQKLESLTLAQIQPPNTPAGARLLGVAPNMIGDAANPNAVAGRFLQDPELLGALKQIAPAEVNQLAGAVIRRSAPQVRALQTNAPETADTLFTPAQQKTIGAALDRAGAQEPKSEVGARFGKYIAGGAIGSALGGLSFGIPGEIFGGYVGELGATIGSNLAARSILGPWMRQQAAAGIAAGSAQTRPPLEFTMAPGQ